MNVDFRPYKDYRKFADNSQWKCMDASAGVDIFFDWLETNTIPLSSSSVGNIYTGCMLNFIYPVNFPVIMSELYRILKSGGLIRINVPDFELGIKYYTERNRALYKKGMPKTKILPPTHLGFLQAWGALTLSPDHSYYKYTRRISLDFETLEWYLKNAGFINIARKKHNDCSPIFESRDYHHNERLALYVEAQKPSEVKDVS